MVLKITQELFNSTVKENIDDFGVSPEEAIEDTVQQMEAQGIDLSNIIQELALSCTMDFSDLIATIKQLGDKAKVKSTKLDEYTTLINSIKQECDKGLQHKVAAGKEGAYNIIVDLMNSKLDQTDFILVCLNALISLMTRQPDLLDDTGVQTIINLLKNQKSESVQRYLLKWVKECCIMHEGNRQRIFDASILDHLKLLLTKGSDKLSSELLRDVLGVCRALVLDDDIRVEFGRAHEHARAIASDTLCSITALLSKFKADETVMSDLMLTLSALVVRTEFCKKVADAGGLAVIQDALVTFRANDKLVRQCLKLIKALAGNDECQSLIVSNGCGPLLVAALAAHVANPATAVVGLGCVAALVLRSPVNSGVLFESGVAVVIVDAMRAHPDNENVQKHASWAIRNMVSRSKHETKGFLELGVEGLLKGNLKKFKKCEYDTKSALRDLGCNVDLKEEWTGKGGMLNTEGKK